MFVLRNSKKLLVIGGVVVAALLLVGGGLLLQKKDDSKTTALCSDRSEDTILSRVGYALKNGDKEFSSMLKTMTDDIQTRENYKSDVNCLYPIVYYRVLTADYEGANELLGDLKAAYGDGSSFARDVFGVESIDSMVENVEKLYGLQMQGTLRQPVIGEPLSQPEASDE